MIDNAVARLSAAGGIDTPTQELLIKTLEQTRPEDWAVVVNEFAKTLEASRGSIAPFDAADGGILARPRTGGVLELDIPARARSSADAPPRRRACRRAGGAGGRRRPLRHSAPPGGTDRRGPRSRRRRTDIGADSSPPAAPLPPQPINVVDLPVRPIAPETAPAPVVVAALIEPAATPAAPAELVAPEVETAAPMPPTPEAFGSTPRRPREA